MHIVLTGGAGFIGSNFVKLVLRDRPDYRITNLDVLTYSGNLENLSDIEHEERYSFVKGDVRDPEVLDRVLAGADAVVHMAAESHVDRSIMDSGPFVDTNTRGTQVLLDAWRREEGLDGLRGRGTRRTGGALDDRGRRRRSGAAWGGAVAAHDAGGGDRRGEEDDSHRGGLARVGGTAGPRVARHPD